MKESSNEGEENKKRILKERALVLAKPREKRSKDKYIEILEFNLAHERYGIQSGYVLEVYPLNDYTQVPCTPDFVTGIINVRGQILSIIDIKKFFELPETGLTDLCKVIIIQNNEMKFGILADEILGVREIPCNEIQQSIPTLTGIRAEYLKGVTAGHLVILDAGKLLGDKKIIVHEEV